MHILFSASHIYLTNYSMGYCGKYSAFVLSQVANKMPYLYFCVQSGSLHFMYSRWSLFLLAVMYTCTHTHCDTAIIEWLFMLGVWGGESRANGTSVFAWRSAQNGVHCITKKTHRCSKEAITVWQQVERACTTPSTDREPLASINISDMPTHWCQLNTLRSAHFLFQPYLFGQYNFSFLHYMKILKCIYVAKNMQLIWSLYIFASF